MAKLSTRRYAAGLEPVGAHGRGHGPVDVEVGDVAPVRGRAPRRRWPSMLAADLAGLDLVALMIDGVHFAEHLCVVALGIGIDGTKHPLGLVEGDTENTTVVTRPDGRPARPGAGHDPPDPVRAGRRQGARGGGASRVRPAR